MIQYICLNLFSKPIISLTGIVTACFAAGVDITAEWGSDLKDGYCTASWRLNKNFCCKNNPRNVLDLNY